MDEKYMERYPYNVNGSMEAGDERSARKASGKSESDEIAASDLRRAISMTRQFLVNHQHSDGHWTAELKSDVPLQADTILLLAFLGEEDSEPAKRCAVSLLENQLEDGGWGKLGAGKSDIDNTVKAFFALKLAGQDPASEAMQRARIRALELGGADRVDGLTRFYLAILGQIPHRLCPVLPPQLMLFPEKFPIEIPAVSAGFRPIAVPLSVISALAPVREVSMKKGVRELFVTKPEHWKPAASLVLRRLANLVPLRRAGIEKARQWILEQGRFGDGPAFHGIVWTWIALKSLGCDDDSEEIRSCRRNLESLLIHDGDGVRIQPCRTPGPDTSLTLKALLTSGLTSEHPAIRRGIQWIRSRRQSDGRSDFYPDCDAAAMALSVLAGRFDEAAMLPPDLRLIVAESVKSVDEIRQTVFEIDDTNTALKGGLHRLLSMQARDGGWAAFDRRGEVSTPDITGRVLETLGHLGFRVGKNIEADRAVAFLKDRQQADGSWPGQWGVNCIYGTWLAMTGMAAVGVSADDPVMEAGANWLRVHQHSSGGWGETSASYDDPSLRGYGEPSVSQTSWAVLGLLAANRFDDPAVRRGIRFLLERQRSDGTWHESAFTGTAVSGRCCLKYHSYSICYPLMALSTYAVQNRAANVDVYDGKAVLRMERIRIFSPEKNGYKNEPMPTKKETRPRQSPPPLRLFLG